MSNTSLFKIFSGCIIFGFEDEKLFFKTGAGAYEMILLYNSIKGMVGYYRSHSLPIFAPMKILMVCLGNICRSPLAEGILQKKTKEAGLHWFIDSAGTNGYHIGEAPHYLSQKVARKNGIDISKQIAKKFVKEDFDKFDKIYAMADDVMEDIKSISQEKFDNKKATLLLNELFPAKNMNVPDPWYGPEKGFYEVFELIEKACEKIIENNAIAISN